MADWNTTDYENVVTNGHSREGSQSSGHSSIILKGATDLNGESRTEMSPSHLKTTGPQFSELSTQQTDRRDSSSGNVKSKTDKSPHTANSETDEDITIPNDANISSFTCYQLASFFKCLKVDNRIISYLLQKNVDGKRFAKMKDTELTNLGMNNPVIVFFRNKSSVKVKGKGPFML